MCSAVRLFCFLIGMVFQQNSSLLLLVNLLFVLTICKGVRFARTLTGGGALCPWRTAKNHTSLWNRRFTTSGDSGVGGPDPTRRGKAADEPLRGRKRLFREADRFGCRRDRGL